MKNGANNASAHRGEQPTARNRYYLAGYTFLLERKRGVTRVLVSPGGYDDDSPPADLGIQVSDSDCD